MIGEYKKCAEACSNTDYGDKKSVRRHNRAVDKMYEIVEKAKSEGDGSVQQLCRLLDDPICSAWLAHQLIEKIELSKEIENKCFSIIESLAERDDVNALGERYWLQEWKLKKKRV